jgi:hypothetical protein
VSGQWEGMLALYMIIYVVALDLASLLMYPMSNIYITRHLVSLSADFLGRSVHLTVSSIQDNYVASQIMSSTEDFSMFHLTFSDPEP